MARGSHSTFNTRRSRAGTLDILELYRELAEDYLAIPVFCLKTDSEKFAGAERTYCIEAMMGDVGFCRHIT